jgi:hypothetical protein
MIIEHHHTMMGASGLRPDRAFRLYLFACGKKDTASIPCAFAGGTFFPV